MVAKNKGGRPSGDKTRCGGRWTEAKYNSFIKGTLRNACRRWGPIQDCIKDARTRRGFYKCSCCGEEVPATKIVTLKNGSKKRAKNIIVDHRDPIVPVTGFTTWDDCIERMFCEADNLDAICYDCHQKKSAEEIAERAINRKGLKDE